MSRKYFRIGIQALAIAIIGVFGVDYVSHLLFSNPMETGPYFLSKFILFFVFSILFLSFFRLGQRTFCKVAAAGVTVAALWGLYYNVLPALFGYYPFGIPLQGLTFLGMGLFGTGIAFGVVHALAFVVGYYVTSYLTKTFYE